MGCRSKENLRSITKETFRIEHDANGQWYIYQQKDETDKNHSERDTEMSNQVRIYEVQVMYSQHISQKNLH